MRDGAPGRQQQQQPLQGAKSAVTAAATLRGSAGADAATTRTGPPASARWSAEGTAAPRRRPLQTVARARPRLGHRRALPLDQVSGPHDAGCEPRVEFDMRYFHVDPRCNWPPTVPMMSVAPSMMSSLPPRCRRGRLPLGRLTSAFTARARGCIRAHTWRLLDRRGRHRRLAPALPPQQARRCS